jgi:hypothetical protein
MRLPSALAGPVPTLPEPPSSVSLACSKNNRARPKLFRSSVDKYPRAAITGIGIALVALTLITDMIRTSDDFDSTSEGDFPRSARRKDWPCS